MRYLVTLLAILGLVVAAPAMSGKDGNGNGNGNGGRESGSCTVDGTVVYGTGLPNWELMNFMVTDASGTSGWVIGFTDDGTRTIDVPDRTGPTTYEFTGETRGPDGSKYDVYASCQSS
jgi:hypothetical protein